SLSDPRPAPTATSTLSLHDALPISAIGRHHIDLRLAAAIALETGLIAVRRVAWRGVDRRRVGEPRGGARAQIHHKQIGVAALLQAQDDALAVGREARRERHAREIADDLALTGLDVQQI